MGDHADFWWIKVPVKIKSDAMSNFQDSMDSLKTSLGLKKELRQ